MELKFISIIVYLISSVLFILGIKRLASVKTAMQGNRMAALGMFMAVVITLFDQKIVRFELIIAGIMIGGLIGSILATRIQMTSMPELVALYNGFGGIASLLVAYAEYSGSLYIPSTTGVSIVLSVLIGGVTFTGSLIAFGKLNGMVTEKAVMYPLQHPINAILILFVLGTGVALAVDPTIIHNVTSGMGLDLDGETVLLAIALVSLLLGVLLVIPIGGADMPVVISLLNSYSGIAAATTGFVLQNNVLIITGSLVGASGIILTRIMCKSMNRSLLNVLLGGFGQTAGAPAAGGGPAAQVTVQQVETEEAAMVFDTAQTVVIVPGYGMAVAQAQHVVKELMELLGKRGVNVRFAIHPVAGRMPGHMNVLLADANIPYETMLEMDDINDDFANTDIALIIGANDVTNPAARHDQSSPIFGMPILNVDKARTVVVIKRSLRPGYAGIDNELYGYPNTLMYLGDAKDAIGRLITELKANA